MDTTKIEGRNISHTHTFAKAWEEAQVMFQESVKKRQAEGPMEV
jgi:hypothetical protein